MLYLNYIFTYSIMGFLMESVLYKITNANKYSGILYGPYTFIYGFGVLITILIYEYLEKRIKKQHKYLKVFIYFFIFTIILTLIEYLSGHILKLIFNIEMWNYRDQKFNFGKYISLPYALIWGFLSTINIYFIYPKLKRLLKQVPSLYTIIFLLITIIDLLFTIFIKLIIKY